jgi:hypothetical protein
MNVWTRIKLAEGAMPAPGHTDISGGPRVIGRDTGQLQSGTPHPEMIFNQPPENATMSQDTCQQCPETSHRDITHRI